MRPEGVVSLMLQIHLVDLSYLSIFFLFLLPLLSSFLSGFLQLEFAGGRQVNETRSKEVCCRFFTFIERSASRLFSVIIILVFASAPCDTLPALFLLPTLKE